MRSSEEFEVIILLAGSRKWQSASKTVSVVLMIAGVGLAFIALVGGNGGPRWSGLVRLLLAMLPLWL